MINRLYKHLCKLDVLLWVVVLLMSLVLNAMVLHLGIVGGADSGMVRAIAVVAMPFALILLGLLLYYNPWK